MAYDKSTDLESVQADVLTTDTSTNTKITKLKQLKTETKVVTKAINALNDQLGNAQASASDALQRVNSMTSDMTAVQNDVAGVKSDVATVKTDVAAVQADVAAVQDDVNTLRAGGTSAVVTTGLTSTSSSSLEAKIDQLLMLQGKNVHSWASMAAPTKTLSFNGKPAYAFDGDITQYLPASLSTVKFTNAENTSSLKIYWNVDDVSAGEHQYTANYAQGYYSSTKVPTYGLYVYKQMSGYNGVAGQSADFQLTQNSTYSMPFGEAAADHLPTMITNVTFTNSPTEETVPVTWSELNTQSPSVEILTGTLPGGYVTSTPPKLRVSMRLPEREVHVYGMVLAQEGGQHGTWVRVNENMERVGFNENNAVWSGIRTVSTDHGDMVEIPTAWVKTETLADGEFAGCNCWWISDHARDDFHVHPAFMKKDGTPGKLQISAWIASKDADGNPCSVDMGAANPNNKGNTYWNAMTYDGLTAAAALLGDEYRPYTIYDHHFLARMMLVEFGNLNVHAQIVNDVPWDASARIDYHGIHDPMGTPNDIYIGMNIYLYGFTTDGSVYNVLATDGSGELVNTGISCNTSSTWVSNTRLDKVNGIDFGDIFIATSKINSDKSSSSFSARQYMSANRVFYSVFSAGEENNILKTNTSSHTSSSTASGWRFARVV